MRGPLFTLSKETINLCRVSEFIKICWYKKILSLSSVYTKHQLLVLLFFNLVVYFILIYSDNIPYVNNHLVKIHQLRDTQIREFCKKKGFLQVLYKNYETYSSTGIFCFFSFEVFIKYRFQTTGVLIYHCYCSYQVFLENREDLFVYRTG